MKDWNEKKLDEELNALVEELPLKDDLERRLTRVSIGEFAKS